MFFEDLCSLVGILELWRPVIFMHYNDVIMGEMTSQITSLTVVYSTVYSDADQRKHQISASLAFMRGIHRWPVNSPHKWPATREMFPFDDVIIEKSALHRTEMVYFCLHAVHMIYSRGLIQSLAWINFQHDVANPVAVTKTSEKRDPLGHGDESDMLCVESTTLEANAVVAYCDRFIVTARSCQDRHGFLVLR